MYADVILRTFNVVDSQCCKHFGYILGQVRNNQKFVGESNIACSKYVGRYFSASLKLENTPIVARG